MPLNLLQIYEKVHVLIYVLHYCIMRSITDGSLLEVNFSCHCNGLLLNLPMKKVRLTLSSHRDDFLKKWGGSCEA